MASRLTRRPTTEVLSAALLVVSWSRHVHAQPSPSGVAFDTPLPPDDARLTEPPPKAYGLQPEPIIDTSIHRSWNEGQTRSFLATTLDVDDSLTLRVGPVIRIVRAFDARRNDEPDLLRERIEGEEFLGCRVRSSASAPPKAG